MKWLSMAVLAMALVTFVVPKSADANEFSFSFGFRDELAPYGTWVSYSNYGNVWRPHGYSGWRPYADGYWAYTSYGPTWYGNESHASYTHHYGNWIYTARYGWVWVPGYEWHPGRVSWSYGNGYVGWRPVFPSGYSYPGSDYNFWVVINADRFGHRNYRPYALRSVAVRDLFARRVFHRRVNTFRRDELERIIRRPLRVASVRERVVRIGDRRSRILVTADEETRIRKHYANVRKIKDNRRIVEVPKQRRDYRRNAVPSTFKRTFEKNSHAPKKAFLPKKAERANSPVKLSKTSYNRQTERDSRTVKRASFSDNKQVTVKKSFVGKSADKKSMNKSKKTTLKRGKSKNRS